MKTFLFSLIIISLISLSVACEPVLTDKPVILDPITLQPVNPNISAVPEEGKGQSVATLPANPAISSLPTVTPSNISNPNKLLDQVVWINPGKVNVDNLYPGAQGEYKITMHNPNDKEAIFSIRRSDPNYTEKGYIVLPKEFFSWVQISNANVTVPAHGTADVLITIKVGLGDKSPGKKYETWIAVKDTSQKGSVQTEICSRWFLTTR